MASVVDPDFYKNFKVTKKLWEDNFPWTVKIMKISFLYPFQNKIEQILGNLTLCSCLILTLVGTILKLVKKKENWIISSTFTEIIVQLIAIITMTFIYMFMIGSKKKLYMSTILMGRMWLANSKDIQEKMMKNAKIGHSLCYFQAASILLLCIGIGTAPVAIPSFLNWALPGNQTYEKNLPLHMDFFVDEDEYFYHIFAIQLIFLFIYGLLFGSMNCFQCCAVVFILTEIQGLQQNFDRMSKVYKREMAINEIKANAWICEQLKDLVRMHQMCIDFYGITRNMSDPLMFGILAGTSSIVVLTATVMVILVETDSLAAAKMLLTFCIALCSIIFICIPSQLLKIASEDFYITSCEMNGQIYSSKMRQMLLFILMRNLKPFVLAAGPTIELNFETCSSIIKTSMSYVATFRSVYNSL